LATRAFMAGSAATMADLPIACELDRWWGLPPDNPAKPRSDYPHVSRWYASITAHPACQGVLGLTQT
jgi:glutathione S-transferase